MKLIKNQINKENIYFVLILLIPIFYVIGSLLVNLIVLLFTIFYLISDDKRKIIDFFRNNFIYIFIFFLIASINILFSETEVFSFKKFLLYLRFFLFFFSYIYLILNISNHKLKILLKIYLIFILFVIFDSLVQLFFGKDLFGYEYYHPYNRITGPFGNEMIVGFYILNFGILFLSLLNFFNQSSPKLNYIFITIFFIFILLTGERTSFLTGFYFLTFLFLFSNKRKFVLFTTISIMLISILTISNVDYLKNKYPVYDILKSSIGVEKGKDLSSLSDKKDNNIINITGNYIPVHKWKGHFERSIEIFKKNVFFGSGFRNYRIVCFDYQKKYFDSINISKCSTHPHNFHLEIISENGIIGYLIFIVFVIYIIRLFIKEKLRNNFGSCMLFCLILSFLIPFKTTGSIFTTNYAFVFWYLIGNYFYLIKKIKKNN